MKLSPLKNEALLHYLIEKNSEKSETAINTYFSIIKQHRKKKAEIPQEHDLGH